MQPRCLNDKFLYCMNKEIKQKLEDFDITHQDITNYVLYAKALTAENFSCELIPQECVHVKLSSELTPESAYPKTTKSVQMHVTKKNTKKETIRPVQTTFEWN